MKTIKFKLLDIIETNPVKDDATELEIAHAVDNRLQNLAESNDGSEFLSNAKTEIVK